MKRYRDTSADVTLYVGPERVAVPAHSQLLALGSDFFDAALGSGMLESQSKCIELPDQDPDAIRLLLEYMSPRSDVKICAQNAPTLIPLFHQFQCTPGLKAADEFCARDECMSWGGPTAATIGTPVDVLKLSVDHGLPATRESAVRRLTQDITPDTGDHSDRNDVYRKLTRAWHRGPEEGTRWLHPRYLENHSRFCRLQPLICDARYAEVMPELWPLIRSLVLNPQQQACFCPPDTASPGGLSAVLAPTAGDG